VLVGNLFPQACSVQLYFWLAGFIWLVWLFDLYTSNIWSKKKKKKELSEVWRKLLHFTWSALDVSCCMGNA
jgi:high-affinity Fe2+/Pb2+ permease